MLTMTTPPTFHSAGLGPRVALLIALGLPAAMAQAADAAALQRCRTITEATVRLACYDALPLRAALALVPPVAGAAPVVAAAPPSASPAAAQSFGQERRDEPQTISSQIAGVFEGWGPTSRIKLANGQVWQVVDGSEGVYFLQSPKVTVKRALMGGFQLDIEGAKRTPRVRRVE